MFGRIEKMWRANLDTARMILIVLLVITVFLSGVLIVSQTSTEWSFILTLLVIIETAGTIASHIYMKKNTEVWQRYTSILMKLSSLLNPLIVTTDVSDLRDRKNEICSELLLLPRIGSLTSDAFNLASSIHAWNPISLSDSSREYYYTRIMKLLNEIRQEHDIQTSIQVADLMHRWVAILVGGDGNKETLLNDLKRCDVIPIDVRNTLELPTIDSRASMLHIGNILNIGSSLVQDGVHLFDDACNEAELSLSELSHIWQATPSDSLAIVILGLIECRELNEGLRKQYLRELTSRSDQNFTSIGIEGIRSAITLESSNREHIITSALSSSNTEVISEILSSLRDTDRVFQNPVISNLYRWNPNQVSDAIQFLINTRYPELIKFLFELYENHEQIASRREAIRIIGDRGSPMDVKRLKQCIKKEPIDELRNLLENALRRCDDINRVLRIF